MSEAQLSAIEEDQSEDIQQFLTFQITGESYGIGILHVKEIVKYGVITPVPIMPDFIAGVINLRGSVVPVVNLAKRFQLSSEPVGKKTSIIVIEMKVGDDTLEVGIVVDMVNEVLELAPSQISPAPKFGAKIRTDFIQSMGKMDDDRFIILLSVNNVLSVNELSGLKELAESDVESSDADSESIDA